jgi:hypothetical protein
VKSVAFYWTDPLTDSRWPEFISRHPSSSVFHTREWLTALQRTYGFIPAVLTTSPPGAEITNAICFCRVNSWLTGKRLVSLPFSDHCQPLSATDELLQALPEICTREKLKYVELRPLAPLPPSGLTSSQRFLFHLLDLRPSMDEILRHFHNDCIRRKIKRAQREGLITDAGRSEGLLDDFFALQVITRRRHGIPPQPRQWFRNLMAAMGEQATIRVARANGRPVAAIMTLQHKQTAIYKYGCSDAGDSNRGGTQLLLWKAIEDAKTRGMKEMDLGRCDPDNEGLAVFKERWGAARHEIEYLRYPAYKPGGTPHLGLLAKLPDSVLIAAGRLLYRHMA